jgi:DNA mismatch repair protein MutS
MRHLKAMLNSFPGGNCSYFASKSGGNRIPLAGVPYHSADSYIAKLVGKGYKVAVVEQVGDKKNTKGIVKRELVRVITPGTVIDSAILSSMASSCLLPSADMKNNVWGMAILDISVRILLCR